MIQRFGSSVRVHAALAAVFAFVVYLITRVPGLYYTDSGELAAACATLGIAHPTGYPLFTIVGHVWLMLPWSSAIDALNILAGVWTAASVGMVIFIIHELIALTASAPSKKPLATLLVADACALLFAFSATVWAQGTSIEVYSLQLLLTSLALWCTLKSVTVRWTALASLCVGLMLANHISSLFVVPGLLAMWYLGIRGKRSVVRMLPWLLVPSLLALALYAYLPLRSAQLPVVNWGLVHRSMEAFMYHVKGTQYSVWLFSENSEASKNIALAWGLLAASILFIGLIPVGVGLFTLFKRRLGVAVGLLLMLVGNVVISVGYDIPDIDNYFLPMLLVVALWFAVGLYTILGSLRNRPAVAAVLFVLPVIALVLGWPAQNRSSHVAVDAYSRWALANAEPGAIIISRQWDYLCSAVFYMQNVEQYRTDVVLIEKEHLRRTWYVPYLQYRYPELMKNVRKEADAYMEILAQFERDSKAFNEDRMLIQQIQQRYVALLQAILTTNASRPRYVTFEIINEPEALAAAFEPYPVGPLVRLGVRGEKAQNVRFNYTDSLVLGLRKRTERLDDGLRRLVRDVVQSNVQYSNALGNSANVSQFRTIDAQLLRRR